MAKSSPARMRLVRFGNFLFDPTRVVAARRKEDKLAIYLTPAPANWKVGQGELTKIGIDAEEIGEDEFERLWRYLAGEETQPREDAKTRR